jgi:putative ABC transport system substrate-binding protein
VIVFGPDAFFFIRRARIADLALRQIIPTAFDDRAYVEAGGLICYGADFLNVMELAGSYAGRILKGEKPADLPVQQPTRFDLVINLKTAKALGITVPPKLLLIADEVIE